MRSVFAAAFLAVVAIESAALADEREQCANNAEQAQSLRDEGKYRRAREAMLVCARDVCPGPIKSDCGKWLSDLDRDAPTVVFGARDAKGSDVIDVKVTMDGATVLQERLDGKPILVDSGEHTFKFEAKDGSVKEERVLLRTAEKARPITASFPAATVATTTTTTTKDSGGGDRSWIVPVAVAGGVGVLGLGLFAGFGISGESAVDDLQTCKPNCKEDDVSSARTKLIIADVALGVGVVAIGVGAYFFFTRPKESTKPRTGNGTSVLGSLKLDGGPTTGGGYAALGGKF